MEEHIRQSNLIENIDDPKEDAQSLVAWQWLVQQPEITHDVICKLQKMVTINQTNLRPDQRGYYRDMSQTNVRVRGRLCLDWRNVRSAMNLWLKQMPVMPPLTAHIDFERIHPFVDGNGRTGRMLMWWQELKAGKEPTLFLNDTKFEEYYPLFKSYYLSYYLFI